MRSSNRIIKTPNTLNSTPYSQTHPTKSSSVPPQINSEGPPVSATQPTVLYRIPNPAPVNPEAITLANLNAMVEDPPINDEPFDATDKVMNEDKDIDMYFNLHNIKDIEMSTNSSKRKSETITLMPSQGDAKGTLDLLHPQDSCTKCPRVPNFEFTTQDEHQ
ncbi:hypothetical protein Cgig2_017989 [Carnegiea gigantea]|uniref:Uncharacterized protein n=1 Tax=Carnegiea gigantea TaxID=171969 RepID=A0A9Q1JS03_9CARY|nr:hypothetical protein Cgig2_017989 [Carnegiea gigantea]